MSHSHPTEGRGVGARGRVESVLGDHKTLHYSRYTYNDSALRAYLTADEYQAAMGRHRQGVPRTPVDVRADAVAGEYLRKARQLDRTVHGITMEQQERGVDNGPIVRRLREHRVEGRAYGTFGEASHTVRPWRHT